MGLPQLGVVVVEDSRDSCKVSAQSFERYITIWFQYLGTPGKLTVESGTTLRLLFNSNMPIGSNPERFVITVNGRSEYSNYRLQSDDRIQVKRTYPT